MSRVRRTTLLVVLLWTVAALAAAILFAEPARAAAAPATRAHPAAASPGTTVPTPRDQVVFFVPHADDDVLSMGVLMQQLARAGHDVQIVYYTDGAGTGVCLADPDGYCAQNNQFHGWPVAQFVAARDTELTDAVEALGVPAENIHIYAPDGQRRRDGTVDVPYATAMLDHYRQVYPDATYVTMSWIDDHPDHGSAGRAMRSLVAAGAIAPGQALFSLARWYWAYDYPGRSVELTDTSNQLRAVQGYPLATELMRCTDDTCLARMHAAVDGYKAPGTGIGYLSVRQYLDVVDGDPEVLLHGVDAGQYSATATISTATRSGGPAQLVSLNGSAALRSEGRYGTDPDDPDNASLLARSLDASRVTAPFGTTAWVTVRSLGADGRSLEQVRVALVDGQFAGVVPVPPGAMQVQAGTSATAGIAAASVTWPVVQQQLSSVSGSGVVLAGDVLTGGYGRAFTLNVRVSAGSKALVGLRTAMTPAVAGSAGLKGVVGRTAANGLATFSSTLSRAGTWQITTASVPGTVPAIGSEVRVRVHAARLRAKPAATHVRTRHGSVRLSGVLTGRDYAIAAHYLVPVRVRVWLHVPGRRARLLGTTHSRPGGRFTLRVKPRHAGTITYELGPVSGAFAAVTSTGRVHVTG